MEGNLFKRIKYLRENGVDDETIGRNLAEIGGIDYDAARQQGESATDMLVRLVTPQQEGKDYDAQARQDFQMIPTGKKMLIGVGKGMTDLGQGVSQLAGFSTADDVAQKRANDVVISEHPVGRVGAVIGETAPVLALPVGAVGSMTARGLELLRMARGARAARTAVGGSALVGAGVGASQPVTGDESRGLNAAIGGTIGAAIPVAMGGARMLSDAFENLTRTPQEAAGKIISDSATDAAAARAALGSEHVLVPGSTPTTGQATRDIGLLGLERTLRQRNPADWTADDIARNEARLNELKRVTGADDLAAHKANQSAVGRQAYGDALMNAKVKGDSELVGLMHNPIIKPAWEKAVKDAAAEGVKLTARDQITGRGLHYLKMALDDQIDLASSRAGDSAMGANSLRIARGVQDKFNNWLESNIPEYQAARKAYAAASVPVNKAEAGQDILSRAATGIKDVKGNPVMTPADFNKKLAANLTTKYGNTFTADEAQALSNIGKDLERSVLADTVKGTKGSDTAQNLVAQRTMAATLKQVPFAGEFLAARAAGRDADVAAILDQAMRDPAKGKQLLDLVKAGDRPKIARLLEKGRIAVTRAGSAVGASALVPQQQP